MLELHYQERQFKIMGTQKVPVAIKIPDLSALLNFVRENQSWQQFTQDVNQLKQMYPELESWLTNSARKVSQYQGKWSKLIKVCQYFLASPAPNCYIRELTVSQVDTKFIESHQAILKELLDILLPRHAINEDITGLTNHGFARRFGLKYDQPLVRFRLLDPQLAAEFNGLTDISLPLEQFMTLDLMLDRVFITENKTNGLSFPDKKNSIVIFGLGYGIQLLKHIEWLKYCRIHYWGDIDSHGFAMLAQIKQYYPNATSLLMNEQVLMACKDQWHSESTPCALTTEQLTYLNSDEQRVYLQLADVNKIQNLRLEQEVIPFDMLIDALNALP